MAAGSAGGGAGEQHGAPLRVGETFSIYVNKLVQELDAIQIRDTALASFHWLGDTEAPIVHRRRRPRKPSAHGPHTLPHPFPTLVSRLRAAISLELSLRRHTISSSFSSSLLARPRYRHRRDVVAEPLALPPALWDPGRGRRSAIVAGLGLTRRVAVHHETVRVGRDRLVERLEVDQVAQLDLHRGRSS